MRNKAKRTRRIFLARTYNHRSLGNKKKIINDINNLYQENICNLITKFLRHKFTIKKKIPSLILFNYLKSHKIRDKILNMRNH